MTTSYVGDTGLRIIMETEQNLFGYSTLKILVKKPDGSTTSRNAFILDSPTGTIYYPTVVTDLDQAGMWYLAAEVLFTNGNKFTGRTAQLEVKAVLA